MRVLDKTIKINKSMQLEMILTIAFPLEIVDKSKDLSPEEFLKSINKAIADYDKEHEQ
jgi:hypothetical protein